MKKLTKKSLDELAKTLTILDEEEQESIIGGGTQSCVFNCFDYLDGDRYTAEYYYWATLTYLRYTPDDSGGVPTEDIGKIGAFGGFSVKELIEPPTRGAGGISESGGHIMMLFNLGTIGHAVVVTGVKIVNGEKRIYYHDPTTGKNDYRTEGDYSAFYNVI